MKIYDEENDVLYVQLTGGEVARTEAVDDLRLIDYDKDGAPIGIEFIGVERGINLDGLSFASKIEGILAHSGLKLAIHR